MTHSFTGLWVAVATPFTAAGDIDFAGFRRLVRHIVQGGVDGLVILGSTGEAATLLEHERDQLLRTAIEECSGKPIVAGTGHNATRQAARWTARAQELGCAGALVVTPFYNKPTPQGLIAHFAAVAQTAPGFPIIAYNVPGRTGTNIAPATMARIWEIPEVVGLKESSGNMVQIGELARRLPTGKVLLAGDDNLALPSIAMGAEGLVSVAANVIPAEMKLLVDHARRGDFARARRQHHRLLDLMDALFCESNPIPLKAALSVLGIAGEHLRLPLTRPEPATFEKIRAVLATLVSDSAETMHATR